MFRWGSFIALLTIMLVLSACGDNVDHNGNNQDNANQEEAENNVENDMANNNDAEDNNNDADQADSSIIQVDLKNGDEESVGTATLEEKSDGVNVAFEGENLPKGTHAFHIHEKGACELPVFKSAEGHYNPDDSDHGYDTEDGPHAGDMPNITVDEDGTVTQSFLVQDVTLEEDGDHSLTADDATALVIHEGADDGESQPSGDAGDRIACGVISN